MDDMSGKKGKKRKKSIIDVTTSPTTTTKKQKHESLRFHPVIDNDTFLYIFSFMDIIDFFSIFWILNKATHDYAKKQWVNPQFWNKLISPYMGKENTLMIEKMYKGVPPHKMYSSLQSLFGGITSKDTAKAIHRKIKYAAQVPYLSSSGYDLLILDPIDEHRKFVMLKNGDINRNLWLEKSLEEKMYRDISDPNNSESVPFHLKDNYFKVNGDCIDIISDDDSDDEDNEKKNKEDGDDTEENSVDGEKVVTKVQVEEKKMERRVAIVHKRYPSTGDPFRRKTHSLVIMDEEDKLEGYMTDGMNTKPANCFDMGSIFHCERGFFKVVLKQARNIITLLYMGLDRKIITKSDLVSRDNLFIFVDEDKVKSFRVDCSATIEGETPRLTLKDTYIEVLQRRSRIFNRIKNSYKEAISEMQSVLNKTISRNSMVHMIPTTLTI